MSVSEPKLPELKKLQAGMQKLPLTPDLEKKLRALAAQIARHEAAEQK